MRSGVYKFTNLINNKVYIGSSSRIEKRAGDHINNTKRGSKLLVRAIVKYGIDNFKFEVLEIINSSDYINRRSFWLYMYSREQYYLDSYFAKEYIDSEGKDMRFRELTYNLNPKAVGCGGIKQTKEHIQKIREWRKDLEKLEKCRQKMRLSASKYDHTKPTGITPSKETIAKCIETKLRKGSIKLIIATDKNGNKYGPFKGSYECAKVLNIQKASIGKCLLKIKYRKTAGGFTFNYINNES